MISCAEQPTVFIRKVGAFHGDEKVRERRTAEGRMYDASGTIGHFYTYYTFFSAV